MSFSFFLCLLNSLVVCCTVPPPPLPPLPTTTNTNNKQKQQLWDTKPCYGRRRPNNPPLRLFGGVGVLPTYLHRRRRSCTHPPHHYSDWAQGARVLVFLSHKPANKQHGRWSMVGRMGFGWVLAHACVRFTEGSSPFQIACGGCPIPIFGGSRTGFRMSLSLLVSLSLSGFLKAPSLGRMVAGWVAKQAGGRVGDSTACNLVEWEEGCVYGLAVDI